ncbi:MAG: hypothetical protein ACI9ES_002273, partial [Oceanospirillaceae bacterium]
TPYPPKILNNTQQHSTTLTIFNSRTKQYCLYKPILL